MSAINHKVGAVIAAALLSPLLGAMLLLTSACKREETANKLTQEITEMQTVSMPVEGMTCGACVARLKRALKSIPGVHKVEVSLEQRTARIEYQHSKVTAERLTAAVNELLGYKAGTPALSESQ